MGNQIISKPDAIREAANNIASLDVNISCASFPEKLVSSDGLVAGTVNEIIEELKVIEDLMAGILTKFPQKLREVATTMEEADKEAANQFNQGTNDYTAGGGGYSSGGGGIGAFGGGSDSVGRGAFDGASDGGGRGAFGGGSAGSR